MTDHLIEQRNQGGKGIIDKMLTILEPGYKQTLYIITYIKTLVFNISCDRFIHEMVHH